jgi:hypothetical protein
MLKGHDDIRADMKLQQLQDVMANPSRPFRQLMGL